MVASPASGAVDRPVSGGVQVTGVVGASKKGGLTKRAHALLRKKPPRPGNRRAKRSIVGGTVIGIRDAPWQVNVWGGGAGGFECGGSILTATTILTAAHCVDDVIAGQDPSQSGAAVWAGVSDNTTQAPGPLDNFQERLVTGVRIHPRWARTVSTTGDVAVLTLGSPLTLDNVTTQAVALPPAGQVPAGDASAGTGLLVTGYGVNTAYTQNVDGALRSLRPTIVDPDHCGRDDNAVTVCAKAPAGSTCQGDSGGPVVIPPAAPGAAPIQVGIVSNGPSGCPPGSPDFFVNLWAPEVRAFIDGSATPPAAPRLGPTDPALRGAPNMREGETVSCAPAAFSGATSVETKLMTDDGAVLASAFGQPVSFTLTAGQAGRKVRCRSYATSAGGIAVSFLMEIDTPVVAVPAARQPATVPSAAPTPTAGPTICPAGVESATFYVETSSYRVRRGRTMEAWIWAYGLPKGADLSMSAVGGRIKQGSRRTAQITGSGDLGVKDTAILGLGGFKLTVPRWAKRGREYTLSFSVTLAPRGNRSLSCVRRNAKAKVRVR
ncbi:MAG: trypsin-like serine protease [Solirubrobacteraceae bacterium]|nr:trypsin-like serine protease [Solirubrobacteraceae bacterium]